MGLKVERVLIVDDDQDCIDLATALLNQEGPGKKIDVVRNGQEALDYLEKVSEYPQVILLDINMPKMNGWEFLEKYREIYGYNVLIIAVITVSKHSKDLELAEKYHVQLVNKPLTSEKISEIFTKL